MQAAAFASFAEQHVNPTERLAVVILALWTVLWLGATAFRTFEADELLSAGDFPVDALTDQLNRVYAHDREAPAELAEFYLAIIQSRRDA